MVYFHPTSMVVPARIRPFGRPARGRAGAFPVRARLAAGLVFALALASLGTGCAAFWPRTVSTDTQGPLFDSGFPLVGGASPDAALCSLASAGADVEALVHPPESTTGAAPLAQICNQSSLPHPREHGRAGVLVEIETSLGRVHGYYFALPGATGLVIAFTGLGMPAAGWINQRFAEVASQRRLATLAVLRDEGPRPIYLDPVREARRAIAAAAKIRETCALGAPADLGFVGISLGGFESLLANREAHAQGLATRAAVLDPVLDVQDAIDNLDSFWHSVSTDSMQSYFRRILRGRYGEPKSTTFNEMLGRIRSHPDALSDLTRDTPSAWLCKARREAFALFLSETDPVLGDEQREFLAACNFPVQRVPAPGHTPMACAPSVFDRMIEHLRPIGKIRVSSAAF